MPSCQIDSWAARSTINLSQTLQPASLRLSFKSGTLARFAVPGAAASCSDAWVPLLPSVAAVLTVNASDIRCRGLQSK